MAKQRLPGRNSSKSLTPQNGQARSPVKGVRRRTGGNHGNGKRFKPGTNSHDGKVHRRGPDRIPRGNVTSLYRTVLDDDGTLLRSIAKDPSFRAKLMRGLFRCAEDTENPRNAVFVAESIADRLEGRPTQKVEAVNFPQAVFYRAGDPLPPGITPPPAEKKRPELEAFEPPSARPPV